MSDMNGNQFDNLKQMKTSEDMLMNYENKKGF